MVPHAAYAGSKNKGKINVADVFNSILLHENDHVNFLVDFLGDAARPKPWFMGLEQDNYNDFFTLARTFENVGVGAYLGAAPSIQSPDILAAAGSIALIEARHAGVLQVVAGAPVSQNNESFETPLSVSEVGAAVAPFIKDLPGPALTYSDTLSAENDIAILNFALALEYLEQEFYQLNVALFNGKNRKKNKNN